VIADNGLNQQTMPPDTLLGMLILVWPKTAMRRTAVALVPFQANAQSWRPRRLPH